MASDAPGFPDGRPRGQQPRGDARAVCCLFETADMAPPVPIASLEGASSRASRTQASPVADVDHSAHSVLVSRRLDTGRWAGPAYLLVERKAERIRRVVRSREAPGSLAGREARLALDRPIDEVIGAVAFGHSSTW